MDIFKVSFWSIYYIINTTIIIIIIIIIIKILQIVLFLHSFCVFSFTRAHFVIGFRAVKLARK
jgi:hypothetical protein